LRLRQRFFDALPRMRSFGKRRIRGVFAYFNNAPRSEMTALVLKGHFITD
jgi:hypothetical protein